jgi:hypothetical protein
MLMNYTAMFIQIHHQILKFVDAIISPSKKSQNKYLLEQMPISSFFCVCFKLLLYFLCPSHIVENLKTKQSVNLD